MRIKFIVLRALFFLFFGRMYNTLCILRRCDELWSRSVYRFIHGICLFMYNFFLSSCFPFAIRSVMRVHEVSTNFFSFWVYVLFLVKCIFVFFFHSVRSVCLNIELDRKSYVKVVFSLLFLLLWSFFLKRVSVTVHVTSSAMSMKVTIYCSISPCRWSVQGEIRKIYNKKIKKIIIDEEDFKKRRYAVCIVKLKQQAISNDNVRHMVMVLRRHHHCWWENFSFIFLFLSFYLKLYRYQKKTVRWRRWKTTIAAGVCWCECQIRVFLPATITPLNENRSRSRTTTDSFHFHIILYFRYFFTSFFTFDFLGECAFLSVFLLALLTFYSIAMNKLLVGWLFFVFFFHKNRTEWII